MVLTHCGLTMSVGKVLFPGLPSIHEAYNSIRFIYLLIFHLSWPTTLSSFGNDLSTRLTLCDIAFLLGLKLFRENGSDRQVKRCSGTVSAPLLPSRGLIYN